MIEEKYIKGLLVTISVPGEDKFVDGRKMKQYKTAELPMKPEDVLAYKDYGTEIIIVSSDGRKHTVSKIRDTSVPKKEVINSAVSK